MKNISILLAVVLISTSSYGKGKKYNFPDTTFNQTEFSVHYQSNLNQYVQIQAYGMGDASIGFRLAKKLEGPWSDPVIFHKPDLQSQKDFIYSANAHPEISTDGIIITYNVNNSDFGELLRNDNIYFPKILRVKFSK